MFASFHLHSPLMNLNSLYTYVLCPTTAGLIMHMVTGSNRDSDDRLQSFLLRNS